MTSTIQSSQTEYYLISNGEESDGSIVATVPKDEYNPTTSNVVIEPPMTRQPVPVIGFVQSAKVPGLYVGYKSDEEGTFLTWTKERFQWLFASAGPHYTIVPANGEDLYWFDKFDPDISRCIALKAGKDVQERENLFMIVSQQNDE